MRPNTDRKKYRLAKPITIPPGTQVTVEPPHQRRTAIDFASILIAVTKDVTAEWSMPMDEALELEIVEEGKPYDVEARKAEFQRGDKVRKARGSKFPGEIVAVFRNRNGDLRYVVECTVPDVEGLLHIYTPVDLVSNMERPFVPAVQPENNT